MIPRSFGFFKCLEDIYGEYNIKYLPEFATCGAKNIEKSSKKC